MTAVRLLIVALLALVGLVDAGAQICGAVVSAVYALAWAVASPFALAAWGLVALSRRITHGSSHERDAAHADGAARKPGGAS